MQRDNPAPGGEADSADPDRWRALAVCLVAGFMTLLDVSIVNVALPSVQSGLRAGPSDVSWVISGYTLTFGLTLIPAGKTGDALGRRRMFLAGLSLFTAVSALCAMAPNPTWLVVARVLQGAAGGLLSPQIIGMIQHLFRGAERGRAFGLYGAVVAISTAVGPLAGGLLIGVAGAREGWRWVFLVNLPIGLLALALGLRFLPATPSRRTDQTPDFVGVLFLGCGIASLLLPLIGMDRTAGSPPGWLFGVAAALPGCFIAWERRRVHAGREPLVDLGLLRERSYGASSAVGLTYFAGYTGLLVVLPLYLQQGRGYSALAAGAVGLPFAVGSAVSSAVGGRFVYRMGRVMVVVGMAAAGLGLAATAAAIGYGDSDALWLTTPLLAAGLGSGLVIGPNQTLALKDVPPAASGTAAAVLQTGQRIGTSIGTARAATAFFNRLSATRGNFPNAASHGLYGAVVLVSTALLIGVADLLLPGHSQS